jgi:hypothetical protein
MARKLENGATLIASRELPPKRGSYPAAVVLTIYGEEYITWLQVRPDNRPAFCTSGHYFDNLDEALVDFHGRRH